MTRQCWAHCGHRQETNQGSPPWTNDQIQLMLDAVDAAPTAKAGFAVAALELERASAPFNRRFMHSGERPGSAEKRIPHTASSAPRLRQQAKFNHSPMAS